MTNPFDRATDPTQYDGLQWINEGLAHSTRTAFFWDYLEPLATTWEGKRVLDIGAGVGWLVGRALELGAAQAVGIEPSVDHVARGAIDHPQVELHQTTLEEYDAQGQTFDRILGIMSFPHIADLDAAFAKVRTLLADDGEVVLVVPDYDYFRMPRDGYKIDIQEIDDDSYAVTITRSTGPLADVVRRTSVYEHSARAAGLVLRQEIAMTPTEGQIARAPKYELIRDQALTRLLVFTPSTAAS
jgi:2-polyprenyl-3-methyl-5-hydroxy-6-metoxy-1,4-benzoquinol methylase